MLPSLDFDPLAGYGAAAPTHEELLWASLEEGLAMAAGVSIGDEDDTRPLYIDSKPELPLDEYMRQAWHVLEPGRPLVWNWHLDAMCERLTAVSMGESTREIINVPFGMSKSMMVCVMWPTWEWTWLPRSRWLFYSYNEQFSTRDAVKSRRLIQGRWYQRRWAHSFSLTSDQNEKRRYENDKTGFRMVSSFGGSVTGERGDRVVIDDPIKASEARNENKLTEVNTTFDEAVSSRLVEPSRSAMVIIMQRVSARDLSGHNIACGGWNQLAIPMEYEPPPEDASAVPLELRNWTNIPNMKAKDPRTKVGELLDPVRYPRKTVDDMKSILGSYAAAAQFQQRPVPAGGGIFKTKWFRFWEPADADYGPVRILMDDGRVHATLPVKLPATFTGVLQSHDLTFTGATSWAVSDAFAWVGLYRVFLLDELRSNGEFPEQVRQIQELTRKWPIAGLKLIEAKANGQAAIATLRTTIPGLVPVPVTEGSKPERYDSVSPYVEAGHVHLPHPDMPEYGWVRDWLIEVCAAPFGTHDDRADTLYMALARIFLAATVRKPRVGSRVTSGMGM